MDHGGVAALTDLPDPLPLPTGVVRGTLRAPASKSVAQRVLNLALLSGSVPESRPLVIDNPPTDDDSRACARALEALGWRIDRSAEPWKLDPPAEPPSEVDIDCASSGTALRLLTASLSTLPGRWTVTGSAQLAARPIEGLVAALRSAGVEIESPGAAAESLPLVIAGGAWTATHIDVDASTSSQYLSALLMAAVRAEHPVTIAASGLVSAPYVDLTLDWMHRFGAGVEVDGSRFTVMPGLRPPQRLALEGDWSSACYPAAGAALTGGTVTLEGLDADSAQADRAFLDILRRMDGLANAPLAAPSVVASPNPTPKEGAPLLREPLRGEGIVVAGTGNLKSIDVDMNSIPDQVPTLACLAPFADGTTVIRGVAHLRHKESDRLAVLARELGRLGAVVKETEGGLRIEGTWHDAGPPSDAVTVDPEGDHRIAMAMGVLATRRPGVSMADPGVAGKSWAGFWQDWGSLLAGGV